MNRKQQTKCVVSIYKLRIFHMSSALFSVIRGPESLQLSLLWLEVLASRPQSCAPFSALPGWFHPSSLSQLEVHHLHLPLSSTGPKYPFYPFALVGLATPFLQGLLYFLLSSLPLQISIFTWRPPLILLSRVLIPQSWLVSLSSFFPFSYFHFPMSWIYAIHQGLHYVLGL